MRKQLNIIDDVYEGWRVSVQEKADYLFTIKVLPYLVLVKKELLRRERQGEAVYQNPSEITPFLHI
ncbi:MAG: hypothetical protein K5694_05765, partial [Bacilli bacterium]|nr:hypothetical protein [Bacilli bacterium]